MKGFIPVTRFGFALLCVLLCISCGGSGSSSPSSSSGGRSSAGTMMLCYTEPTTQDVSISDVFTVKTTDPTIMLEEPWAKDFRTHIAQAGGQEMGRNVTCDQVTSKDAEKKKVDELRKQGHTVHETGYVYAN